MYILSKTEWERFKKKLKRKYPIIKQPMHEEMEILHVYTSGFIKRSAIIEARESETSEEINIEIKNILAVGLGLYISGLLWLLVFLSAPTIIIPIVLGAIWIYTYRNSREEVRNLSKLIDKMKSDGKKKKKV